MDAGGASLTQSGDTAARALRRTPSRTMPLDKRLLEILCCPLSRQPVVPLNRSQVEALNRAIASGEVRTVEGEAVATPLREGLITRDGKLVYRIDDGIPVMLADQALGTQQLHDFPA